MRHKVYHPISMEYVFRFKLVQLRHLHGSEWVYSVPHGCPLPNGSRLEHDTRMTLTSWTVETQAKGALRTIPRWGSRRVFFACYCAAHLTMPLYFTSISGGRGCPMRHCQRFGKLNMPGGKGSPPRIIAIWPYRREADGNF